MKDKITQTAGRDSLGEFAPEFAHFNDDVLFGENWNDEGIDLKTRCIITVVALVCSGVMDSSLTYHLQNAKAHGVSRKEIASVLTHIAFYAGWPKAWAGFRQAKEVWKEEGAFEAKEAYQNQILFPIGEENKAFEAYFDGKSYLAPVVTKPFGIYNVTFEPGTRNHWHIHNAKQGGGQILVCVGGRGYYQEEGKGPIELLPGDSVSVAPGVKHWHGAAPDSWFSHLAIEVPGEGTSTAWLEPVDPKAYSKLR